MPGRPIPLVNGEIYHVINRGIASQPTFTNKRDYQRAQSTLIYYQNCNLPFRYSRFTTLSQDEKQQLLNKLQKSRNFWVEILAYCLMPNHFHFLLKQLKENGISIFLRNFTDSYTRYFNTKQERNGPIFQGRFKAVRIETDEQLLHVGRYIHLNPHTSYVVKTLEDLENYPYSSLPEYLGDSSLKHEICNKEITLGYFKNSTLYKQFVFEQADYQRTLGEIKHLCPEK